MKIKFQPETMEDSQGRLWFSPDYVEREIMLAKEAGIMEGIRKPVIHIAETVIINEKEK
jgi:hypothetical protein